MEYPLVELLGELTERAEERWGTPAGWFTAIVAIVASIACAVALVAWLAH